MDFSQNWCIQPYRIAEQYRHLAEWIERTNHIPWHIDIDWTNVSLLIHLHDDVFFHEFKEETPLQFQDRQGTTFRLNNSNLVFTCFVPHLQQKESA